MKKRLVEKNVPTDPAKWSYYKSQAKKKFDVYPSAYANAWAAKKYKAAGGKWKTEEAKLEKEKFTKPDQMRVNELVFTNTARLDGYEVAKFVKAYKKLNTKNLVRFDKSKGMYYGYPRGSKQPHWKYDKDSGKIYHSLDNQLVLGLLNAYNMVSKNHPWTLSESINEGIRYNMEMGIPLENPPYRYGSRKFFNYINELRQVNQDVISDEIKEILNSDIGKIGIYEGKKVPLDFPMLVEAEYQGKDVELNKPKRGGSKKFYVYVKDGDKVKKVSFGAKSGGQSLAVKLQDPKARKAFADRHDCKNKTDKTKAGYWACRIGRYWKSLGGGENFSGYW